MRTFTALLYGEEDELSHVMTFCAPHYMHHTPYTALHVPPPYASFLPVETPAIFDQMGFIPASIFDFLRSICGCLYILQFYMRHPQFLIKRRSFRALFSIS